MKVSIVIPHKDHWELTHALLFSLFKLENQNIYEILLVDDGSQDSATIGGEQWWMHNGMFTCPVRVIRLDENVGFLRAANKGLKKASGEVIVLLSNDVQIGEPFISKITATLTDNARRLIGGKLYSHDTGWNKFGDRLFPYLEGWLLAATADGWKDLGYLDERFGISDYEDVDLSTTAISKGYELFPLNIGGIVHMGGQTIGYNDVRLARTLENQKIFRQKWIG